MNLLKLSHLMPPASLPDYWFTPRAEQVLVLAGKEADRLGHSLVRTEHILLGLIRLGQSVGANLLEGMGVDLDRVRMAIETEIPSQESSENAKRCSLQVKTVLEHADKEARELNQKFVGTEHLLLGLLLEREGLASIVLGHFGIEVTAVRRILKEVDSDRVGTLPDTGQTVNVVVSSEKTMKQFTPRTQQVLAFARKEAEQMKSNCIGVEHILLGLLRLDVSTAVKVLKSLGVNLETAREEVEKKVSRRTFVAEEKIPFTPRVKKVLASANVYAEKFSHLYIGTEHILLGLLAEGEGSLAGRILVQRFGLDLGHIRTGIERELEGQQQLPNTGQKI